MNQFYFNLQLTENEHDIAKDMINEYCAAHNLILVYYRKFKNCHIPMYREVKITGRKSDINRFKIFFDAAKLFRIC